MCIYSTFLLFMSQRQLYYYSRVYHDFLLCPNTMTDKGTLNLEPTFTVIVVFSATCPGLRCFTSYLISLQITPSKAR